MNRDRRIELRLSQDEIELVEKHMKAAGINNMSAFIRKIAIDGLVIRVDLSDLQEVTRLMQINANNLNQYTKKANETGSVYLEDIKDLHEQHENIWNTLNEIWGRLATIR